MITLIELAEDYSLSHPHYIENTGDVDMCLENFLSGSSYEGKMIGYEFVEMYRSDAIYRGYLVDAQVINDVFYFSVMPQELVEKKLKSIIEDMFDEL